MRNFQKYLARLLGQAVLAGVTATVWAQDPPAVIVPSLSPEQRVGYGIGQPVPPGAGGQPAPQYQLSPELMRRYGLTPPPVVQFASDSFFDLDFEGGTPAELVKAINDQMPDTPVNVVIPEEHAKVKLPAMRMKGVTVASLFEAISASTVRRVQTASEVPVQFIGAAYKESSSSYSFKKVGESGNGIWVFSYDGPSKAPPPRMVCRFFQLDPFLQSYSIDDITTAIRTGYGLLAEQPPEMKFHEETRLLIAVGPERQLELIDAALRQMMPSAKVDPVTGVPVQPPSRTLPRQPPAK